MSWLKKGYHDFLENGFFYCVMLGFCSLLFFIAYCILTMFGVEDLFQQLLLLITEVFFSIQILGFLVYILAVKHKETSFLKRNTNHQEESLSEQVSH